MKYLECLPREIAEVLAPLNNVRELRLRNGRPVKADVGGIVYYLSRAGLTQNRANASVLETSCDDIVKIACNSSIYAYEKMLVKGYFTLDDGCRIGVSGVIAGQAENTFRKYTSLCFRIPHYVNCITQEILEIFKSKNVIVIGPPNSGKTTFLRDYACKSSLRCNVLAVDERGELFYDDIVMSGHECDVLKWSSKKNAFEIGVRSMSPDVIVCDELSPDDEPYLMTCLKSGVNVVASVHGSSIEDFKMKYAFADMFQVAVIMHKDMTFTLEEI